MCETLAKPLASSVKASPSAFGRRPSAVTHEHLLDFLSDDNGHDARLGGFVDIVADVIDLAVIPPRAMQAVNPRITSVIPLGGRDGQLDRGKVEVVVEYGFRVIHWHFADLRP